VDELAASRRRVWFGMIMVVAFGLLIIGALLPAPSRSLRVEQASADETVPAPAPVDDTASVAVTPTTVAQAVTVAAPATTEVPATTSTTQPAPSTTTTTSAPRVATAVTTPAPAAAPAPTVPDSALAFLACIRNRESHGNYGAVSSGGTYRGAYQFSQSSWDSSAAHAGRSDLVGQLPNLVAPADQDAVAYALYQWQGAAPWGGACT